MKILQKIEQVLILNEKSIIITTIMLTNYNFFIKKYLNKS